MVIREITIEDAASAAALSGELGYPVTPARMEERIRARGELSDHAVYVACDDGGAVVAWIDVGLTHHLQSDEYAEIGGLVVSEACRSTGVGRELVARAEEWAAQRGIAKMVVRSRIGRERAHRFYLREGYTQTKVSAVFSKELDPVEFNSH